MCVLSIKVPIQKKSGNLFNDPCIRSRHYEANRDERKSKKRESQNKKTFWNQTLQQKSYQRNRYLGSLPYKTLLTILQINKEIDDDTQGLTPERLHKQTLCAKKRKRKKNQHWELCRYIVSDFNQNRRTFHAVDFAVPAHHSVKAKEGEKLDKY